MSAKLKPIEEIPYTLQEALLTNHVKKEELVHVYLITGIKLVGTIKDFDQSIIALASNKSWNDCQMVYKHAISTIVSAASANDDNKGNK